MSRSKFRITVVRILAHTGRSIWPDDYPGMTLAEAVSHEQAAAGVTELLAAEGQLSTTVTSTELPEG